MASTPDQRHEVTLVDRKHAVQRLPFAFIVSSFAQRPGQVHPQIGRCRIGSDRAAKQGGGLLKIAVAKGVETEHVQRRRLLAGAGDHAMKQARALVAAARGARLARGRQRPVNLRLVHAGSISNLAWMDKCTAASRIRD